MAFWRFEAIGTHWEVETVEDLSPDDRAAITALIDRFDRSWSRFREDSDVTRLGRDGGRMSSISDAEEMFAAYRDLSAATGGAVNPLVGESLAALGYDRSYTLTPGDPIAAPIDWTDLLRWSPEHLTLMRPGLIDIGALGKGRLVDRVLEALGALPGDVVVDGGGDLRVRGDAVRVGLEHPYDPTKAIGVVTLHNAALCASAVNRRAWGDGLHHVLDARTGIPVRRWAATWAIAPTAMRADAVATALFFDGGPGLAAQWGVEWVRMATDGSVERSPECPAELFISGQRSGLDGSK